MESRTQGSRPRPKKQKKILKPRTALQRTDPLEAKDRNARGQGQRHGRKWSQKKFFKKFFSRWTKEEYKKGLTKFSARFLAFSNTILRVQKKCCSRAEDRAILEDLRLRSQELQNVSSTPRTSSRTLPLLPGPDAFGMRQQSGECFAPNSMLSSFITDFASNFGGKHQKNKKGFHYKILRYLITFTWSVVLIYVIGKSLLVLLC